MQGTILHGESLGETEEAVLHWLMNTWGGKAELSMTNIKYN